MVKGKHRIYFLVVAFPSAFLVGALVVFGASFLAATFLTSAVLATFGVSFFSAVLAATLGVAVAVFLAVSALVALAFSKIK